MLAACRLGYNWLMRIDVAFLPSLLRHPERNVCVVIDVLRASSTLVTLIAHGVPKVTVVAAIEDAFALRNSFPAGEEPVVCGEVGGLPPQGFDYGNSPLEFSQLDLSGRSAVLFTSNGTKALVHAASAPVVFAGALLNQTAVTDAALKAARGRALDITFVCSGTELGTAYCLEDAFCAGALVARCLSFTGPGTALSDGAETVLRLFHAFSGDASKAFAVAEHGHLLGTSGLEADVKFCAREDVYPVVPRVERRDGRVVVFA